MDREKKRAILCGIPAAVCLLFGSLIVISNINRNLSFLARGLLLCWIGAPLAVLALPGERRRRLLGRTRKREVICWGLAVTCLLPGIFNLSGGNTASRFIAFLLCCAGAAFAAWALLDRWSAGGRRWALWCKRVMLTLIALGLALFAGLEAWVISWARTDETTPVEAVVVFGAGVSGTIPSVDLLSRVEAALDYVADKPDIPIVVTGSQGPGEDISEARCMADWLMDHGVAEDRILLEERADNTEENVRYSLELLAERGVTPSDGVAVVTSDYHLCRGAYLFRRFGGVDPVPVAAHMPELYRAATVGYFIREAFAMAAEIVF